jgi:hypothetical protein
MIAPCLLRVNVVLLLRVHQVRVEGESWSFGQQEKPCGRDKLGRLLVET